MSLADWLTGPSGLTAHGFCLSWEPGLIALHAGSDAIIAASYFSVPLALLTLLRQRHDIEYRWIISLFVAFIVACGLSHLLGIVTLWLPIYEIEGVEKAVTAALSLTTAIALWPLVPRLVALPSPSQLERLNRELSGTIAEQQATAQLLRESEARIKQANAELERRVEQRTEEISATNARLSEALKQRDLLLREVYHRVKNNLQVVDGLLFMHMMQPEDAHTRDSDLSALRARIHTLGLVHQQLMASSNLETFNIAPFLHELCGNIASGSGRDGIELSVDAMDQDVTLDIAIPFGLIVTELVTNSLKHAFPQGSGGILVRFQRDHNGDACLTVSDTGDKPFDFNKKASKSSGLGHTILHGLVAQLGATMKTYFENGFKTEICLDLPAPL
jgi:two-component sensor histidine kinase